MKFFKPQLETIAMQYLDNTDIKPNFTNREFMNAVIIFQTALMDKMFDNQDYDKMDNKDREQMAINCGMDLRKLIHTYTNLDTHKIEDFI